MAERTDHDVMQRAAELPVKGPAVTNTLAASGGLEVPGREPQAASLPRHAGRPEPIPGEHDHTAEATTEPAIVGTTGYGVDLPPTTVDPTVDDEEKRVIRWEAGGRIPGKKSKHSRK